MVLASAALGLGAALILSYTALFILYPGRSLFGLCFDAFKAADFIVASFVGSSAFNVVAVREAFASTGGIPDGAILGLSLDAAETEDNDAIDDFLDATRDALSAASERVRLKFGYACSSALDQWDAIERAAEQYRSRPAATVTVVSVG